MPTASAPARPQALPAGTPEPATLRLAATELTLFIREQIGPIWGLGLPVVLLVIFGSIPSFHHARESLGGQNLLDTYMPVLVALALALLGLSALPSILASYRERGILRRMSTTPIGPQRVLGAQLAIHLGMAIIATALVLGVGRTAYGAALPRQPAMYALVWLLAAVALLALGLVIAAIAPSTRVAQGIGSLTFFPLMFFAGLWVPIPTMPNVLRSISGWTPLGAAVQSLSATAVGHGLDPVRLLVLAGYGLAFAAAAARLFRWE